MYFLKKSEVISYLFKKYRALTIYLLDYYATGQGSSLHIYARGGISLIGCQIMILMNKKMDRQFFIICDSYRYEKTTFPRMYMKFSRNYIRAPTSNNTHNLVDTRIQRQRFLAYIFYISGKFLHRNISNYRRKMVLYLK